MLASIVAVYWPVTRAGFVWVDKIVFHDNAWLSYGEGWKELVFRNFYEWTNYFRPLVVALFTLEVRIFDASPGPMHVVSLVLHLANTAMVGVLVRSSLAEPPQRESYWPCLVGMAIFGLHPALIEPVVWVSSQYDLVATFFILAGLVSNVLVRRRFWRSLAVSVAFFLAACAKESAFAFPFLLFIIDVMRIGEARGQAISRASLQVVLRSQIFTYAGVAVAATAYLTLRHWAMGTLVRQSNGPAVFSVEHLQTIAYLYTTYWRVLVWPMQSLGPLHEIDLRQFAEVNFPSLFRDGLALALLATGAYAFWKRTALGALVAGITAALLPVLHVIPVSFDASAYHERYAIVAVAMLAIWIPEVVCTAIGSRATALARAAAAALLIAWTSLAAANIRVTLPLWSDEVKLWRWVLVEDPTSVTAKDHLLSTYLERGEYRQARPIADEFLLRDSGCITCVLNAANLALAEGDSTRAERALEKTKEALLHADAPRMLASYVLALAQLRELQNDVPGAEAAFRDAMTLEPLDPLAPMGFAAFLARQRRPEEARKMFEHARELFAPAERPAREKEFEALMSARVRGDREGN